MPVPPPTLPSGTGPDRGAVERGENVGLLDVESVDVVQKSVPGLGHHGQRPLVGDVDGGLAGVLDAPFDIGIANGADAMCVSDQDRPVQPSGFFQPGGAGHFTVAVQREPSAEDGRAGLLAVRPDGGNSSAHRMVAVARDERGVAHFESGDIGDGVQRTRRAFERNTQLAGARPREQRQGGRQRQSRSDDFRHAEQYNPQTPSPAGVIQPVSLNRIHSCVDIRPERLRDFHAPILYL